MKKFFVFTALISLLKHEIEEELKINSELLTPKELAEKILDQFRINTKGLLWKRKI
jgi:hypothetical protein